MKKYKMKKDEKSGLYRIIALRDIYPAFDYDDKSSKVQAIQIKIKVGDIGGLIEKEENLSQEGECWIGYGSKVIEGAKVRENALVTTTQPISEMVIVKGFAMVLDDSTVRDQVIVQGKAVIKGNAIIKDNVVIDDKAVVGGNAIVSDKARILGEAIVEGDAEVSKEAVICGKSHIHGKALITGDAKIDGEDIHGIRLIHKTPETKNKAEDLDKRIQDAISFIKSKGYRVYKKVEEWKEIN